MSDTERSLIYSIDNDLVETQIFGQGASVNCFIFSSKSLLIFKYRLGLLWLSVFICLLTCFRMHRIYSGKAGLNY